MAEKTKVQKAEVVINEDELIERIANDPELLRKVLKKRQDVKKAQIEDEIAQLAEQLGKPYITCVIEGFPVILRAKRFHTGNIGYHGNTKLQLNGHRFQVNVILTKLS